MPIVGAIYGLILIVLGLWGYFGSGQQSVTALIPAFFGLPVFIVSLVAQLKPSLLKHMMHVAAMLGLLGFLGAARGLGGAVTMLTGGTVERPTAVISQSVMAVASAIFVALCVRSFIEARRARERAGG